MTRPASNDTAPLDLRGALELSLAIEGIGGNRHAWLDGAAAKVRRWREEDRRNGVVWEDER